MVALLPGRSRRREELIQQVVDRGHSREAAAAAVDDRLRQMWEDSKREASSTQGPAGGAGPTIRSSLLSYLDQATFGLGPRVVGTFSTNRGIRMDMRLQAAREASLAGLAGSIAAGFGPTAPGRLALGAGRLGAAPLATLAARAGSAGTTLGRNLGTAAQFGAAAMGGTAATGALLATDLSGDVDLRKTIRETAGSLDPSTLPGALNVGQATLTALLGRYGRAVPNRRRMADLARLEELSGKKMPRAPADLLRDPADDLLEIASTQGQLANLPFMKRAAARAVRDVVGRMNAAVETIWARSGARRLRSAEARAVSGIRALRGRVEPSSRLMQEAKAGEAAAFATAGDLSPRQVATLRDTVQGLLYGLEPPSGRFAMRRVIQGAGRLQLREGARIKADPLSTGLGSKGVDFVEALDNAVKKKRPVSVQMIEDFRQALRDRAKLAEIQAKTGAGFFSDTDRVFGHWMEQAIREVERQAAPQVTRAAAAHAGLARLRERLPEVETLQPQAVFNQLLSGKTDPVVNLRTWMKRSTRPEQQAVLGWYFEEFLSKVTPIADDASDLVSETAAQRLWRNPKSIFQKRVFDEMFGGPQARDDFAVLSRISSRVRAGFGRAEGSPTAGRGAVAALGAGAVGATVLTATTAWDLIVNNEGLSDSIVRRLGTAGVSALAAAALQRSSASLFGGRAAGALNRLATGQAITGAPRLPAAAALAGNQQEMGP